MIYFGQVKEGYLSGFGRMFPFRTEKKNERELPYADRIQEGHWDYDKLVRLTTK